jgi:hypothetical protein
MTLDACLVDGGAEARFIRGKLQFGGVEVGFCCSEVDSVMVVRFGCCRARFRAYLSFVRWPAREAEQPMSAASCLQGGTTAPSRPPTDLQEAVQAALSVNFRQSPSKQRSTLILPV